MRAKKYSFSCFWIERQFCLHFTQQNRTGAEALNDTFCTSYLANKSTHQFRLGRARKQGEANPFEVKNSTFGNQNK